MRARIVHNYPCPIAREISLNKKLKRCPKIFKSGCKRKDKGRYECCSNEK